MNQEKIGSFIAQRRKDKKLTQAKLASYLGISDRTISKWERGKGLPDPMYMLELCQILDISVNELLTGEFIEERNYQQKAEDNLLMMAGQEVKQTKKMFFYENVIGIGSTSIFLILIFMSVYFVENSVLKELRNATPMVHNCAQTIMEVYADDLGINKELANHLGCNFGGGMKCGSVCGAITSGLMILGAKGIDSPAKVNQFIKTISNNHHGLINCADLLKENAKNGGQKKPHCDGMIQEVIELIDQMEKEND